MRDADAVVEAMRPGGLERRGLGFDELKKVNPKIVFCTISGYGATGPYRDMPSHGIAYDVWAGVVQPEIDDDGFVFMPEHVSIGINAGSGVRRARPARGRAARPRDRRRLRARDRAVRCGRGAIDWLRSETWRAYERPESEVTGNEADNFERRAPGTGGMQTGVRYQFYATNDGHILFMASEREFWKNFCEGIGRADLFEKWPGSQYGDHARGNTELRAILRDEFATRTTAGVARVRTRAQHADRAGELAEDALRRPAVQGPDGVAPGRAGRRRHVADADQVRRRGRCRCRRWRRPSASTPTQVLREALGWDDARI